jgi:hypothetical protein
VKDSVITFVFPQIFGFTGCFVVVGGLAQISYVALDVTKLFNLE